MSERTQVWSSGGGTQSAAIAALIVQGKLPAPDLAIIVDTEREKSATWEYLEAVISPALVAAGVELVRVPKSLFTDVDLYAGNGDLLIPAYTNATGELGKLPTFCSDKWKRRVVQRWLRAQGVVSCDCWIGISVDEMRRMRLSREGWFQHRYPLIELRMRRSDCYAVVKAQGWPEPPRSACWMCPQMGDREWGEMQREAPEDFARAIEFEREMRQADPYAYLHASCRPLDSIDFTEQPGLFNDQGCASGMCFI